MKGCLAYHYELNEAWNTYIGENQLLFAWHNRPQARFLQVKLNPVTIAEAFVQFPRAEEKSDLPDAMLFTSGHR